MTVVILKTVTYLSNDSTYRLEICYDDRDLHTDPNNLIGR